MKNSSGIRNAHILGRQMLIDERERPCPFTSDTQCGTVGNGDRTQVKASKNRACHAGLKYMDTEYAPSKVVDVLMFSRLSDEERLAWYSFILERSVYSPMFAEKRAKTGFKRGYFIYHAGVNANIMVAGAVAIRMASEKPHIASYFYELVKAGTDEDIAFIIAHTLQTSGDHVGLQDGGYLGHVAIAPHTMKKENLLRYFKADIEYHPTYTKKQRYDGINSMFGETNPNGRFLIPLLSKWRKAVEDLTQVKVEERRIALFNLRWNEEEKAPISYDLPKDKAYPLLAKILNEYKQEILHEA